MEMFSHSPWYRFKSFFAHPIYCYLWISVNNLGTHLAALCSSLLWHRDRHFLVCSCPRFDPQMGRLVSTLHHDKFG